MQREQGESAAWAALTGEERLETELLLTLAQYRALWQQLQPALRAAEALLSRVPPAEMAWLLTLLREPAATDDHALATLLGWLREVAAFERTLRQAPSLLGRAAAPAPWPRPLQLPEAPPPGPDWARVANAVGKRVGRPRGTRHANGRRLRGSARPA